MLVLKAFFGPFSGRVQASNFSSNPRLLMAFNSLCCIIIHVAKAYANILACLVCRTELLPTRPE
jgi:hypothetical protein